MTKKYNRGGSRNQNSPRMGNILASSPEEIISGDDSKGVKRNKQQRSKRD